MRLIDADWLEDLLLMHEQNARAIEASGRKTSFAYADGIRTGYADVGLCPTIEAEPVRRGRWEEYKSKDWSGGGAYICSVCGYGYSWAGFHEANEFNYCPNCGAKMEE